MNASVRLVLLRSCKCLAQFQHHLMGSYRGYAAVKVMADMHEILGLLLNGGLPEATIRIQQMSFSM